MIFDEATITVRGGDGGNGIVAFRREKYVPLGGPSGGNGGRGGHVYLIVDEQLNTLIPFTGKHHFRAENGISGQGKGMRGRYGQSLYIHVPPGTVVWDHELDRVLGDLRQPGETLLVAAGGRGGRGNEAFKTGSRTAPRFAENGEPGKEHVIRLELKLIADVGLLGKPNAGKSTLLASISAARPKIAEYPFTTLQPNLGVVVVDDRDFVVADIPGLIEGASDGVGLGIQFLRHVERTRLLVHLLDGTALDPVEDMRAINHELALYSPALAKKPQIIVLTKMDLPDAQAMYELLQQEMADEFGDIHAISAVAHIGVQDLLRAIADRLNELPIEEDKELFIYTAQESGENISFEVFRDEEGLYHVKGQEIERLAIMTDWNNEAGVERFERIMIARGISEALSDMGVELGDTVVVGDIELEWR